jgi:hypothetical protein
LWLGGPGLISGHVKVEDRKKKNPHLPSPKKKIYFKRKAKMYLFHTFGASKRDTPTPLKYLFLQPLKCVQEYSACLFVMLKWISQDSVA